ncbi:hypothetical protein LCGC14_2149490, partial [marine sediment metagenome]
RHRTEHAIKVLTDQAKAGKLSAGPMPKVLADAVAAYATINRDFPAAPAWADQATLAERTLDLTGLLPPQVRVVKLAAPYAWALEIAGPAMQPLPLNRGTTLTQQFLKHLADHYGKRQAYAAAEAGAEALLKAPLPTSSRLEALRGDEGDPGAAAVTRAAKTVTAIVSELAKFTRPASRPMALAVHTQLLAALSPDHSAWTAAMGKQLDLLDANAKGVFSDNVRAGRGADNAKGNEYQQRMQAAMAKLVGRYSNQGANVLARLRGHLPPWTGGGHYELARGMYERLAPALRPRDQRVARLAVAGLWAQEVAASHRRRLSAGLEVPRKLDAGMVKALQIAYALQDGLEEGDGFLAQARAVWDGVVDHYRGLKYFDIAAEAVKVKPPAAAPAGEAYAALRTANLLAEAARRELAKSLKHYGADEKIALTDAFKTAIAAYQKFITDHPDSRLVGGAAGGLERIAAHFTPHKAHDVAAAVYRDLAALAAKVKVLAQVPADKASAAQRWQLAAAGALHAKATEALAKLMAEKKPKAAPPAKISDEFAAAIDAYKAFVKANPDSVLLGRAIGRIMAAGLEYAKVGAWDVAEGIYAGLLADNLGIARPERIELARGLCHLGKVIPDHARTVLTSLTSAGLARAEEIRDRVVPHVQDLLWA